jgi:hypothetical protein
MDDISDLVPELSQPAVDALEASQPVFDDDCGGFLIMIVAINYGCD